MNKHPHLMGRWGYAKSIQKWQESGQINHFLPNSSTESTQSTKETPRYVYWFCARTCLNEKNELVFLVNSEDMRGKKELLDGAMCTLGLTKKSSNEDDMVEIVAFAEVYRPNPEGKIHNIPMDNHMRVNITIVKDGFDEWALPVTNDVADQFILSDGVGTFVQWPRDLIFLKGEEPPSFDKRSTTKGNKNAFVLKASPLEKETLARFPLSNKKILNLLKEDVLELHEMFELLEPQHCQFSISLSEETFHYTSNDLETIINREDLSQFLIEKI